VDDGPVCRQDVAIRESRQGALPEADRVRELEEPLAVARLADHPLAPHQALLELPPAVTAEIDPPDVEDDRLAAMGVDAQQLLAAEVEQVRRLALDAGIDRLRPGQAVVVRDRRLVRQIPPRADLESTAAGVAYTRQHL